MSGKKTNKDWWSNMVDILPETCQVFIINRCIIYSASCHTKSHTVLVGSQFVLQEVLLCQLSSMSPVEWVLCLCPLQGPQPWQLTFSLCKFRELRVAVEQGLSIWELLTLWVVWFFVVVAILHVLEIIQQHSWPIPARHQKHSPSCDNQKCLPNVPGRQNFPYLRTIVSGC